jgi:hypothetical protein
VFLTYFVPLGKINSFFLPILQLAQLFFLKKNRKRKKTFYTGEFMKFFKYSLLFSTLLFLNSQDCWAMKEEKTDDEHFFKSPTSICVNPPTLATFYHEDDLLPKNLGPHGEKMVERMLKKYQLTRNKEDIKIYTSSQSSDNGFDFVVVDDHLKKIVFLEVKSTESDKTLLKTKPQKQNAFALLCATKDKKTFSGIVSHLQKTLKKTTKTKIDQLSRQWCEACSNDIKLVQSGDTKSENSKLSLNNHLQSLIEGKDYKFMRVAALTICHSQNTKPLPTPTYYAIVGDGKSNFPKNDDQNKKQRIVNAGLDFLFDNQELSLNEAQEYLYTISEKLKEYRYPIEIINGSQKIIQDNAKDSIIDLIPKKKKDGNKLSESPKEFKIEEKKVIKEKINNKREPKNITEQIDNNFDRELQQKEKEIKKIAENDNTPSLKNNKKRRATVNFPVDDNSPIQPKKPKSDSINSVLKQFVEDKNGDYTKEKLKNDLQEISESSERKKFKLLSSFLYKVINNETIESKFLNIIKQKYQKTALKTLNFEDVEKKIKESMVKDDEVLKEFFKVTISPLFLEKKPKKEEISPQNNQIDEKEEIELSYQDNPKGFKIDPNPEKKKEENK